MSQILSLLKGRALLAGLLVMAFTTVWLSLAFNRPLAHPDEGRYAEIPREMLASGDWTTPHLNGLAYLEKPPLQYWVTAAAYKLFGISEWSARLCTMLAAGLNVLIVFLLGRRLRDSATGALAAAVLASCVLHFALGQVLTLDMMFSCAMTAMLAAFCMAQLTRASAESSSHIWMLASWAFLGLAVLTKGLVAMVIAGTVLVIYVPWQRDWAVLRTLRPVTGVALFALLVTPWFIQVSRANADFLQFFFVREHFQRYLTDEAQRVEPWWYFLKILAAGALPWLPQMGAALCSSWRQTATRGQFDASRVLWIWCVFILVFFSLSHSKLAPYILPLLPPLALLTAARGWLGNVTALRISICIQALIAVGLLGYVLFARWGNTTALPQGIMEKALAAAVTIAAVSLPIAAACWWATRSGRTFQAALGLAAASFLCWSVLFASVGHDPSLRSGKSLAAQIPAELARSVPIFSVRTYDQTLPFYLRRRMLLVDSRGELDYGLQHAPERGIDDIRSFETTWRSLQSGIAIMPHKTYATLAGRGLPMRVLGKDTRRIAVSRQ